MGFTGRGFAIRGVAKIALFDPLLSQKRVLVSDMPADKRPVSIDPAISARMMITYFRGALYGWAAGFYSDEKFEKLVRLAGRLSEPDTA
jgi:hypothetical protein